MNAHPILAALVWLTASTALLAADIPRRLSAWNFDGERWFASDQGQGPLVSNNVSTASSFTGTALQLNGPGSRFIIPETQPDGSPNYDLLHGSIRFWFKPTWGLSQAPHGGRLLEVGLPMEFPGKDRPGAWSLHFRVERGTPYLRVQVESSSGPGDYNSIAFPIARPLPPSWLKPRWHQLTVTTGVQTNYESAYLFSDGATMIESLGRTVLYGGPGIDPSQWISPATRATGMSIGTRTNGVDTWWANGLIDRVEFFNWELGPLERHRRRTMMAATVASDPGSITLLRPDDPYPEDADEYLRLPKAAIYRRVLGTKDWGAPVVDVWTTPSWTDTQVATNVFYEYSARYRFSDSPLQATNYVCVAADSAPVHRSGQVILLVDTTLKNALNSELADLKNDLIADGWKVKDFVVPRHDDSVWKNNVKNIASIASTVAEAYDPATTNYVYIVGHVAIPYSGTVAADGHPDHRGAWVCDAYYGCLDKSAFTDIEQQSDPVRIAERDDGRFDANFLFDQQRQMAVGRVDFARMPSFRGASYLPGRTSTEGQIEVALLKHYLRKARAWRRNETPLAPRVCAFERLQQENMIANLAGAAAGANFGFEPGTLFESRSISQEVPCAFGFYYNFGRPDGIHVGLNRTNGTELVLRTTDLARTPWKSKVFLQCLWGSYFADWNLAPDNFLRAQLAAPEGGLVAVSKWGWRFEQTAAGAPIGSIMFGEMLSSFQSLLGDPTLRLHRVSPVEGLRATRSGNQVALKWKHPDPAAVFYVYRSTDGPSGFDAPLGTDPVRVGEFTDDDAPARATYMVRAATRITTSSGRFHGLAMGQFAAP